MEITIKNFLTLLLLAVLFLGSYLLYKFIIVPYKKRLYYIRQGKQLKIIVINQICLGGQQVGMTQKYVPFLGDFKYIQEDYADKGKFIGHYIRDLYMVEDAKPVHLFQWPNMNVFLVNDMEWLADLNKLIPKY
mmetsp:Transcript_20536/g.18171  ORF Transcript_20536/g.18171 Transcript_20536/m.18171 type:complete len:133 (+) Transcript_20536:14-412(+)